MESNIKQEVIETLISVTKNSTANESHKLKEDLGLDSIRIILIVTKLTKKLNVNILDLSDQDLVDLDTVTDLIRLFESKSET
ncbi:MAG: phosphopantetheine-binding protein [Crocinitomicaceae bacterium]